MEKNSHSSPVSRTKEVLQVYLNLPEIISKFERDNSMSLYVDMVSNILSSEVDFVLQSAFKRSGVDKSHQRHQRDRTDD